MFFLSPSTIADKNIHETDQNIADIPLQDQKLNYVIIYINTLLVYKFVCRFKNKGELDAKRKYHQTDR